MFQSHAAVSHSLHAIQLLRLLLVRQLSGPLHGQGGPSAFVPHVLGNNIPQPLLVFTDGLGCPHFPIRQKRPQGEPPQPIQEQLTPPVHDLT